MYVENTQILPPPPQSNVDARTMIIDLVPILFVLGRG
jgi:hypothetical protein